MKVIGFLARETARRQQPQAPAYSQAEVVTDDEALDVLGMAA